MKFTIAVGVIAAASCASAFVVPAAPVRGMGPVAARSTVTRVYRGGKYDGQLWDKAAKDDVKSMYDPSKPRSETNFDPFEKDRKGNKCDASGWYPGDTMYKDPIRPQVSYADYMASKAAEGGQ